MIHLVIWIHACIGLSCPIPTYEVRYYDTMQECQEVLDMWRSLNKENRGVCREKWIDEQGKQSSTDEG